MFKICQDFPVFGGPLEDHIPISMFGYASDADVSMYFKNNEELEQRRFIHYPL